MKLKIYHLLSLLFISTLVFSQDEIEDKKWKKSGNAVFLVNQSSFSNWTSGGQSSISGTLKVDYNYNYSDNGWAWDTKIFSNFGLNKISGSEFLKKTDDRIEVNSVLGKKFNNDVIGKWSYSSFFNFQTQFAKGYRFGKDSNGNPNRTEKSRFFSPATLQLGVGLYWKKSKDFWVNVAPMTGKLILVNRFFTETLNENETYFGVKKGGNSRFELGASVRAYYKSEIFKNINLENRLSLYSDYLDRPLNVDFDCTFNFVMKVNQYISTNLIFQFVYDDNEIKRVQIREVLGLGLNIDLSNIRI
ncbi:DUF3078 domain-containing protein [Flavobacteriaceae bacterium]|nr:DUF3078 domain-containing protein [Flavobacteriaceae bacterium]